MSRTLEPFDRLQPRQQSWIESLNPNPLATMTKEQTFRYLAGLGLPLTFWAVKKAVIDGVLPSQYMGVARRVSEFDALVWYAMRDRTAVSA